MVILEAGSWTTALNADAIDVQVIVLNGVAEHDAVGAIAPDNVGDSAILAYLQVQADVVGLIARFGIIRGYWMGELGRDQNLIACGIGNGGFVIKTARDFAGHLPDLKVVYPDTVIVLEGERKTC